MYHSISNIIRLGTLNNTWGVKITRLLSVLYSFYLIPNVRYNIFYCVSNNILTSFEKTIKNINNLMQHFFPKRLLKKVNSKKLVSTYRKEKKKKYCNIHSKLKTQPQSFFFILKKIVNKLVMKQN